MHTNCTAFYYHVNKMTMCSLHAIKQFINCHIFSNGLKVNFSVFSKKMCGGYILIGVISPQFLTGNISGQRKDEERVPAA